MGVVGIAFELEYAVDEVLEHARAGNRPVFCDMTDENRGHAMLLRDPEQSSGRLPHLGNPPGRRPEVGGVQRLHGIDRAHVGTLALERGTDGFELGLGEDLYLLGATESVRAKLDLRDRLLAGDEERSTARPRDVAEGCEQERRLAHPRLASHEDERSGDESSPEDTIELRHARSDSRRFFGAHLAQPLGRTRDAAAALRRRRLSGHLLDERAECTAAWALAEPAAGRRTALGADVLDDHLCHAAMVRDAPDDMSPRQATIGSGAPHNQNRVGPAADRHLRSTCNNPN